MAVAGLRSTDSFEKYLDLTGKKQSVNQGLPRNNGEIQLFSNGKVVEPEKGGSQGVRRTSETNTGAAAGSANAPTTGTGSDPMSMTGSLFQTSLDGGVVVPMGPSSSAGVGSVLGASGINQPDGADRNAPQDGATGGNQRGGATAGGSQNGTGTVNDMLYSLYEQAIKEAKDAEAAGGGIFGADILGGGTANTGGAEGTGTINGAEGTGGTEGTNPPVAGAPQNNSPVDDTGDVPNDGTKPNNDNKPEDNSNNTSKGINNQEEKRVEQERLEAEQRRRLEAQKNDEEAA